MKKAKLHRRIDYRKALTIISAVLLLLVGYEAIEYRKARNFTQLSIEINHEEGARLLISKAGVLELMRNHLGFDPSVAKLEEVDVRSMEEKLEKNKYIKEATIYINGRHELHVVVEQRRPIARIKTMSADYYLSRDGISLPLSEYSTMRVPVITGHVNYYDSEDRKKEKARLVQLLNKINENDFFSALVEQIDIDIEGKLVFIPKLGNERIIFGMLENTDEKLDKIGKYYAWGKRTDGWDKYAYLNLETENQIALGKKE